MPNEPPDRAGNWIVSRADRLGEESGGGVCYACCNATLVSQVAKQLPEIQAIGSQGHHEARIAEIIFGARRLGVRPDNLIGVIKFPKGADARFKHEVEKLQRLAHSNLIRIFDADAAESPGWFVMEFHSGGDLTRQATREVCRGNPLEVLEGIAQVGRALAILHRAGIVHRDVKPKNVLLSSEGRWVLADLGVALDVERDPRYTVPGHQPFSRDWRPDWVVAAANVNAKMDVQMLAKVAYYMLEGGPVPPPDSQIGLDHWNLVTKFPGTTGMTEVYDLILRHVGIREANVESANADEFVGKIETLLEQLQGGRPERSLLSFFSSYSASDVPISADDVGPLDVPVDLSPKDTVIRFRVRLMGVNGSANCRLALHDEHGGWVATSEPAVVTHHTETREGGWSTVGTLQLRSRTGSHWLRLKGEPTKAKAVAALLVYVG